MKCCAKVRNINPPEGVWETPWFPSVQLHFKHLQGDLDDKNYDHRPTPHLNGRGVQVQVGFVWKIAIFFTLLYIGNDTR